MKKSMNEWKSEALSFIHNWGGFPEYSDVVSTVHDLAADAELKAAMEPAAGSVDNYATELWLSIRREMVC